MTMKWSKKGDEKYIPWRVHGAGLETIGLSFLETTLRGNPICFTIYSVSMK